MILIGIDTRFNSTSCPNCKSPLLYQEQDVCREDVVNKAENSVTTTEYIRCVKCESRVILKKYRASGGDCRFGITYLVEPR